MSATQITFQPVTPCPVNMKEFVPLVLVDWSSNISDLCGLYCEIQPALIIYNNNNDQGVHRFQHSLLASVRVVP